MSRLKETNVYWYIYRLPEGLPMVTLYELVEENRCCGFFFVHVNIRFGGTIE